MATRNAFPQNTQQHPSSSLSGTWSTTGQAGFSTQSVGYGEIKIHPSGKPWVVYSYGTPTDWYYGLLNVTSFDGNSWVQVGANNFAVGLWTTLAFTAAGIPFVAYGDNSFRATVMSYDGTTWGNVGNPSFTAGETYHPHMAMSPSDQPYVVYEDGSGYSYSVSVMKFDGSSWGYVGAKHFSNDWGQNPVIEFSPGGEPYVAHGGAATVMKFDGTSWVLVGNAGFSPWPVDSISLAFNASGEPYVAFGDGNNGCREWQ